MLWVAGANIVVQPDGPAGTVLGRHRRQVLLQTLAILLLLLVPLVILVQLILLLVPATFTS